MFLSFKPIYVPKIKVRYSSINEILTIKEYWNLIGQEPFLAITWEPDFSQACSFCRMLMNHKNFCFTQFPDKTNDVIFLKSPKTLFLEHFWPLLVIFAQWGFFAKNLALSQITIYRPLTPCQVSEKTNEPILRKFTDRWKDRWTLFYRTLPAKAGDAIRLNAFNWSTQAFFQAFSYNQ